MNGKLEATLLIAAIVAALYAAYRWADRKPILPWRIPYPAELSRRGWYAVAAVAMVGLGILGTALEGRGPGGRPAGAFRPGDRVALFGGAGTVFVATSDAAWDDMIAAIVNRSPDLMIHLVERGRVALAPNGTRVVVIRTTFTAVLVLLDGHEVWARKEEVSRYKGGSE